MDALGLLRQCGVQMEWGADEALDETPVDRLRPVAAPPAVVPRRAQREQTGQAPIGTPVERAIRAAAGADSLDALRAAIKRFEGCPLRLTWGDQQPHRVRHRRPRRPDVLIGVGGPPGCG